MAVIMNIAALKLCCKEADEQACPATTRPRTRTVAGTHAATCPTRGHSVSRVSVFARHANLHVPHHLSCQSATECVTHYVNDKLKALLWWSQRFQHRLQ